jgi:hypothetical protein
MRQAGARPNVTNHDSSSEPDFSLMLGGPLYQLYLRTRLARPPLKLVPRRIIGISAFCWLPMFVLSLIEGHAFGGVRVPFLLDIAVHARFLAALPLLIGSELMVHQRIGIIVRQFLVRGIITQEERGPFEDLFASTMRLRNSVLVELALLVFVFSAGPWLWRQTLASTYGVSTWYAVIVAGKTHMTAAGHWYQFVSASILRFIVLRWYFRIFLWYRFVWRVRGLPLHLDLFHPDRVAGLGFLAGSVIAFAPVLVAQTIVVAGAIGDRIWHGGQMLTNFKEEIAGTVAFLMLVPLIPLCFFIVKLELAERVAKVEYGTLASRYVEDFRRKWIQEHGAESKALLGTPDIQSQADLGNVYSSISKMRLLLFNRQLVIRLAVVIMLPLLPLTLTIVPLEQLVIRLIKLVFNL